MPFGFSNDMADDDCDKRPSAVLSTTVVAVVVA